MQYTLLIIVMSFLVFLLIFEIMISVIRGDIRKIPYCIGSILCSLLVVLCWWNEIQESFIPSVTGFGIYLAFVFLYKLVAGFGILKESFQFKSDGFIDFLVYDAQLLIVSPDYVVTKLCKDAFWNTKGDKRRNLIWGYNLLNLSLSVIIVLLFSSLSFIFRDKPEYMRYFICILGYRIISRTIEVAVSFIRDVCEKKSPASSLQYHERIKLAFLSILEIVILTFGIGYCVENKGSLSVTDSICQALLIINSLPSKDSGFTGVDISRIFSGLACISLIGVVISSYIGDKKSDAQMKANHVCNVINEKMGIEDVPGLLVSTPSGAEVLLSFRKNQGTGKYELILVNCEDCVYSIHDQDGIVYLTNDFGLDENIFLSKDKDKFKLAGHIFEIQCDADTKEIVIKRKG